jgi:peptidoglycan/LPS O-acetylase OafA/YrhL
MSNRIIRLEACRGIAAWVVVVSHSMLVFTPETIYQLAGSIFFFAVNGAAAVAFFFVLSGYVLSARFFENPDPDRMASAAIKRLPRLALLTTLVTLTSAALWMADLYQEGAPLLPDIHPSLTGAFKEGAWRTFMAGDASYDSSIWTMVYEFRGSLLVFVTAPFLVLVLRRRLVWLAFPFAAVVFHYADPLMIFFLCGMAIAYYQKDIPRFPWPVTAALFAAAVFLLSYNPTSLYVIDNRIVANHYQPNAILLAWAVGASCLIVAVLQSAVAERLLDNRIGAALGYLSFPAYLVHFPILWSAGSTINTATGNPVFASICTIALTAIASWPLAFVDAAWVRFLNRRVGALLTAFTAIKSAGSPLRG